ncbi:glycosyltransferase family 4 protein [Flavobacterium sinopsychrotolerans]|uniref:Glycosyltransferase involved in cell wall bisynthesis n=1 Tax=Flavobacterium sinopsychrotolerans TaxID=604089 RepID=A0A1H8RL01_9FLAO|nr:glycosyltransferase family 4 protein [Flavobacterium sinopsychrotolerans]SEO67065.1 Glycosyltransferase involved in cell wall bisynthesis [Flavobacterium sinopsychrotolerans]
MKLEKFKLIFIFIPHHHIGGAERVHLNIIKSLKWKPIVFFDYSNTYKISKEFKENAYCFLITNAKRRKFAFRFLQIISSFLPIVFFGSNSSLFYNFITKLKSKIIAIDLTHAFSFPENGMEISSLPYINLLNKRVVINNRTFEDYKILYKENGINDSFLNRFRIISNGIKIYDFDSCQIESRFSNFTIGFVGRNSPEKRPELFFELIKELGIKAKAIGDNFGNYKKEFPNVTYFENCNNEELIRKQFSNISILVVTSSREGFPLVIMEAMELGIPVISSNVGSISEHLIDGKNGFLAPIEPVKFIEFAAEKIIKLIDNKELYFSLSLNAREHAKMNFALENFNAKYQELFYE